MRVDRLGDGDRGGVLVRTGDPDDLHAQCGDAVGDRGAQCRGLAQQVDRAALRKDALDLGLHRGVQRTGRGVEQRRLLVDGEGGAGDGVVELVGPGQDDRAGLVARVGAAALGGPGGLRLGDGGTDRGAARDPDLGVAGAAGVGGGAAGNAADLRAEVAARGGVDLHRQAGAVLGVDDGSAVRGPARVGGVAGTVGQLLDTAAVGVGDEDLQHAVRVSAHEGELL